MPYSPIVLRWGTATNRGTKYKVNQDSFVADETLFAVADGLGGYEGGEVASKLAVGALQRSVRQKTLPLNLPDESWMNDLNLPDAVHSLKDGTRALYMAFHEADKAIVARALEDLDLNGMATTLCVLQLLEDERQPVGSNNPIFGSYFAVGNVGDSRLYHLRAKSLVQVTVDHTVGQDFVTEGHMRPEEARLHESRHKLTRALGGFLNEQGIDMWEIAVCKGDRFLLCSDGLIEGLRDEQIAKILIKHSNPQKAADVLLRESRKNDISDDATVVVVDVGEGYA